MNKIIKIIISLYAILVAIGVVALILGDGGITIFLILVIGTPLAGFLIFIWRDKKEAKNG